MKIICHICDNQLASRKIEDIPGVDDILECPSKNGLLGFPPRHATIIVSEHGITDVWYAYWTTPDGKETYRLSSISFGKTTKLYKVGGDFELSLVLKLQVFTPLPLKDDKIDIDYLVTRLLNLKAFS
jgi:hypothetical protein